MSDQKKASSAHRQQRLAHGIVGDGVQDVTRHVPIDEPPPLPANANLEVIGKPVNRLDARQKVTGEARYTCDVHLPGMLYARRVVSTVPHARIVSIDTSAAESYPGVRAVHVLKRTRLQGARPAEAQLRDPDDEVESRYPVVRYTGQAIAAVAAESQRAADAAAHLLKVEYEPLAHVISMDDAARDDAPMVFPGPTEQIATAGGGGAPKGLPQQGNLRGPDTGRMMGLPRGDVTKGFAEADVIVDAEYRTQVQTHVPLETHGVVADWRPDGLTIYASTQFTRSVRDEAADVFGLPRSRVRVISDFTGGGFGAKFGLGNYGLLAINLSRQTSAPVRLMLDRREEHTSAGNRPSSRQELRIGARQNGALTAIEVKSYGTGGVAAGAGIGMCHALMYPCPNVKTAHYDVFTNAGPCAAQRAPGQVQGIFGFEQSIDELAEQLGIDPVELRDRIDISGSDDSAARRVERRIGAERVGWPSRRRANSDSGPLKRGLGMAQSYWYSVIQPPTACEVRIMEDGSVEVLSAAQDIGTGTRTVLAQVVAEELGLRAEEIGVHIGDTRYPVGPPSGGSRVTGSLTPAARNAAHRAARDLASRLAPALDADVGAITFGEGHVGVRERPSAWLPFKEAVRKAEVMELAHRAERREDYEGYALVTPALALGKHGIGGVQFAEVTVDTETGVVKVQRVVAVHDCGRPINPKLTRSQIIGGVIQGMSYALYEERHLDSRTGVHLNANIDQYKMVGSFEAPEIDVHIIEQLCAQSSTDARGVAEPANVATAAAIANAFFNATGKRIRTLPMTPAHVLEALRA
jgi:xanthine dehydrogenase YagR molybdenum-binding subunit